MQRWEMGRIFDDQSQQQLNFIINIQFLNSNIDSMHSESNTIKLKSQRSDHPYGSHLQTYQGQIIRKSICVDHQPNIKYKNKQKISQRVLTETSEKCQSIDKQLTKNNKKFRAPFKSTSPNIKKKLNQEEATISGKFSNSATNNNKKKPSMQSKIVTLFPKSNTETGPLIKKKKKVEKVVEKELHMISQFKSGKKQEVMKIKKSSNKKIQEYKSIDKMNEKAKNHGTFDTTPKIIVESDLENIQLVGQGTFGKVYKSKIKKTGQIVAVKKVFQDPKYKNREIEIVMMLEGEFTMKVLGTFTTVQENSQYLNIIMEHYDCDLFKFIKENKKTISIFDLKVLTYQAFRGLLYIHSLNICHRDIKPHNMLIKAKRLVLCDFGSAKILTNEPNLPYICSRCYRAPELIFGANHYTTMIDIWSLGCVILEMLHGNPLFIGESSIDHLIEIIKVMGTPTKTQVVHMNPNYDLNDYKFPKVKKKEWRQIFPKVDSLLLDLIEQIMIYSPKERLNAAQALCHEFYDEIREQKVGKMLQKQLNVNLFDFSFGQIRGNEHLLSKLIPSWVKYN